MCLSWRVQQSVQLTIREDLVLSEGRLLVPVSDDLQDGAVSLPLVHRLPQTPGLEVRVGLLCEVTATASLVHKVPASSAGQKGRDVVQEEGGVAGLRQASQDLPWRGSGSIPPWSPVRVQGELTRGD